MILLNNPEVVRILSHMPQYRDHLHQISIGGFKSEYIPDRHQISIPDLTEDTVKRVVAFVDLLTREDMCFISSENFGLQLAVVAAWMMPADIDSYVAEPLKNKGYFDLMRKAIQESGMSFATAPEANKNHALNEKQTSLFSTDSSDIRTIVMEHSTEAPLSEELPSSLEQRFHQILDDLCIDPDFVHMARINSDTFCMHFKEVTLYTKEIQEYLKQRFSWIKEYYPDLWSYDSMLVYLSDQPYTIPDSMSVWILENPGKPVNISDFFNQV